MEQDIHISSFVRLGTKKIIKPPTGKLCWGMVKSNCHLSKCDIYENSGNSGENSCILVIFRN